MTDNDKPKVSKIRSDVVLADDVPIVEEGLVRSLEYLLEKAKAGEAPAGDAKPKDDNVVDAEFKEVNDKK